MHIITILMPDPRPQEALGGVPPGRAPADGGAQWPAALESIPQHLHTFPAVCSQGLLTCIITRPSFIVYKTSLTQ